MNFEVMIGTRKTHALFVLQFTKRVRESHQSEAY